VARTDLAKFPLLRTFVASQVAVYLNTALYVRPDGRAALKQDPRAEAVVFEQAAAGVASEHAPKLDKQVAILLVRGARTSIFSGSSEVGAEFIRSVRDARDGRNTEDVIIPGGHLLVQENPDGVGASSL
jgi:pimeloyl-ACP methyl ester carboxylesterase